MMADESVAVEESEQAASPGSSDSALASDAAEVGQQSDSGNEKALAEAQAEISRMKDQLLRTAAEFENYKKRTRREMEETRAYAAEKLLLQMIPVLDNFDRALSVVQNVPEGAQSFVNGVKMVADQFRNSLEQQGAKRYVSVGQPFDPSRHEAVSERETSEQRPGTVVEEYQSGYTLADRVIRPAMVVVAKKPEVTN